MSDAASVSPDVSTSGGYAAMEADLAALDSATDESTGAEAEAPEGEPQPVADEVAPDETEGAEEEADPEENETPVAEEDPAPVEAKIEADPDLPEGVTVRDKNGKKEWVFPEARGRNIYGGYKSAQAVEQIFGEVLTPEAAQQRQDAYVAQEMMIGDYMSGDPRFLTQLAQWSQLAQENGEVERSPLRQLVSSLPQMLIEMGDRETIDAMAKPLLRHQLDELYEVAVQTNDRNLLLSLQHIDNRKFQTFKKEAELLNPDPLAKREQDVKTREEKLAERDRREAQVSYGKWQEEAVAAVKGAVNDELGKALQPIEASYAKFPTEFAAVKDMLHREFRQRLQSDPAFQATLKREDHRAANAKSPAIREAVKAEMEKQYRAKAQWFFDPTKNPRVKQVFSERANAMKERSAATHQRQQVAASRRDPGSAGSPVPQRVSDQPNGHGANAWAEEIEKALT